MEPVDDVNVGVEDDETRRSIGNYEEAVAQVLEKLRNRGAANSLKRVLAFANEELTASDHGLAEGTGKSKRLNVVSRGEFSQDSEPDFGGCDHHGRLRRRWAGVFCFHFQGSGVEEDTSERIFRVTVTNLLTKLEKKLPFMRKVSMVHMVKVTTDAQTQRYKVLLVGVDLAGGQAARDYNPGFSLGKWSRTTRTPHGTTLEYKYHWGDFRCTHNRDRPAAYDHSAAAGSQLVNLFQSCPLRGSYQMHVLQASPTYTKPFCLHQDRVFVLNKDSLGPGNSGHSGKRYYITEYSIGLQPPFTWVHLASHRCEPFENPPQALYRMALHACEGILLVVADLRDPEPAYSHVIVWLYDLTTLEWRELPKPPQAAGSLRPWDDLMCTLRWNSHP